MNLNKALFIVIPLGEPWESLATIVAPRNFVAMNDTSISSDPARSPSMNEVRT